MEPVRPPTVIDAGCVFPTLFEGTFFKPSARLRHPHAPLLKEREDYLRHQTRLGRSRGVLQNIAADLLQIVRVMRLTDLRPTSDTEIREAGQRRAAQRFILAARGWYRFTGSLTKSPYPAVISRKN